jgi:uncharacterized protein
MPALASGARRRGWRAATSGVRMSKLDPASGSLESILASIRKSLAEQSPDALGDPADALVEPDRDAKPQRKHRLTQRLAGTPPEVASEPGVQASDDLSDLLEGASGSAPPAPASTTTPVITPSAQAPAEQDPLWFLTRRDESAAPKADVPPPAAAPGPATSPEPKLTRPEVLRASMPPFFGSSTDTVKPTSGSGDPAASSASTQPPSSAQGSAPASPAPQPVVDAASARHSSPAAAAADARAARSPQPAGEPVSGDKAGAASEPQPAGAAAHQAPHTHALETMVLDLLKPMLRQWLDENMPRLVAEALSGEVQRARGTESGVKKT